MALDCSGAGIRPCCAREKEKLFSPTKQNERFDVESKQKAAARRVEAKKNSHFPPGRQAKAREGKRDSNLKQGDCVLPLRTVDDDGREERIT